MDCGMDWCIKIGWLLRVTYHQNLLSFYPGIVARLRTCTVMMYYILLVHLVAKDFREILRITIIYYYRIYTIVRLRKTGDAAGHKIGTWKRYV